MRYPSKIITSFLGAFALIAMLSVPSLAAVHTPETLTTTHISTEKHNTAIDHPANDAFLHILSTANQMVQSKYSKAQFYTAEGTPKNGRGTTAQDVNQWLFTFIQSNSTLTLLYKDGHFGKIKYIKGPFVGSRIIELPLRIGLSQAIGLLHQHHKSPFTAVTIRFPLYPGYSEPYYIFTVLGEQASVFIGALDGKVK